MRRAGSSWIICHFDLVIRSMLSSVLPRLRKKRGPISADPFFDTIIRSTQSPWKTGKSIVDPHSRTGVSPLCGGHERRHSHPGVVDFQPGKVAAFTPGNPEFG